MTSPRQSHIEHFLTTTAFAEATLNPLAGDASFRRYIRLHKGAQTAMLMDAPPDKEDVRPFVHIATLLNNAGYSAPAILAQHPESGLLLLEDLGDDLFSTVLKRNAMVENLLYETAIDVLVSWRGDKGTFPANSLATLAAYDEALLSKEVALFSQWYAPQIMERDQAEAFQREYLAIWGRIFSDVMLTTDTFVHRDYHADNLMWLPERSGTAQVGLLDFQDGVRGDPMYDLVSLLEDARRDVPPALAEAMLSRYITLAGADNAQARAAYALLGAQRNSKIVGIFTRLAVRDNKLHYLNYLPRVWRHLERNLAHPLLAPLKALIDAQILAEYRGVIAIEPHRSLLTATA